MDWRARIISDPEVLVRHAQGCGVKPRLLANENCPLPALTMLREAGWEIESVLERMPGASDRHVVAA
ncbi:MAG: hypothetical protein ACREE7_10550 [Dongiaceae bacterium]